MKKRFLSLLLLSSISVAGGLLTPFNNVYVQARPGESVDVKGAGGKGLLLFNRENRAMTVQISVLQPSAADLPRGTLPIPDVKWVSLQLDRVVIPAHQEKEISIRVTIPSESYWKNKKFEFYVWTRAEPVGGAGVIVQAALLSRVYITIRP